MRRVGLDQPWRTARGHGGGAGFVVCHLPGLSDLALWLTSCFCWRNTAEKYFFSCTSNNFFSFGLKVIIFNRILDKFHGMYYLFCLCNGL